MAGIEQFQGVLIAGAGPIGMTAAVALAQRGIPVRVYEQGHALSTESRASTFHPSSLELLEHLQVADRMLEDGLVVSSFQFRDRTAGLIARFDYGVLASDTRYPFRVQFEQSKLTPLLLERLDSFEQAEVRFGARVVSARNEDGGVVAAVEHATGLDEVKGSYVIGADGASSLVRKSLDIPYEGMTYPDRILVISTTFDFDEVMSDISLVNYIADPDEWFALLRTPDHWRASFPLRIEEDENKEKEASAVQSRLRGIYAKQGNYPIVHLNIYRAHRRVAAKFSEGRVALAGDAAHTNNPLGGLGMNSGIMDAFFLAHHLEQAWSGEDGVRLLREYGQRHRHMAVNVIGAQGNYNWVALSEKDEEERARQQSRWRALASDPEQSHQYLMKASLLTALRELESAVLDNSAQ